ADLPDDDVRHFRQQDSRRLTVAVVMFFLAAGVYVGARLPPRVAGRPNLRYVETWVSVLGLVVVLLTMAMVDWWATRRYGARHRQAIALEGLEILRDELRRRAALGSTSPRPGPRLDPSEGANDPSPG